MAVEKRMAEAAAESIEVILRTGQSLRVRPIGRGDRGRLKDFFYRLTPETRFLRFQYAKEQITEEELTELVEAAPPEVYGYAATTGEGPEERIVAVGRWDMLPDRTSAEVAFTVEDNIQLRGVGTILLEELARAAAIYRISRFVAHVLAENARMLEVFDESGFRLGKENEDGLVYITIDLADQDEYVKRRSYREHIARSAGVRIVLQPKKVAVIGASRDPQSVGGALFGNLLKSGFRGPVFPVNPNAESIAGVLAYKNITEVPGPVDLAVIAVPAALVLDAVDGCAAKGVGGLVIISSGFAESGAAGAGLEKKLRAKVLSYGMRVIGPNCLGVLNNDPDIRLNATFSPVVPPPGNLSIGSQSGALGLALLDHAKSRNIGVKDFVSFGNRTDISSNDLLEYWEDDERTGVIALYLESFGNPRKFGRIARRLSHKKPVIAVKAGRSAAGAKAAASHTGALAASDVAADALFRQAGVIRVTTIEEMFNAIEVLSDQPLPRGPRTAILTNAGGPGVLAADACAAMGLAVPRFSDGLQKGFREFLPGAAAVANPVDMIATAPAESYRRSLDLLLGSDEIDSVIVIYIPPLVTRPEDISDAVNRVLSGYGGDKPVVTSFMMSQAAIDAMRQSPGNRLRPFVFPEDAVQALALAYSYSRYRQMEEGSIVRFADVKTEEARRLFSPFLKTSGWLMPETALGLLKHYGIGAAETIVARDENEALTAAVKLGFPVVMKVRSGTIIHKSDVAGVVVIRGPWDVKKEYVKMKERIRAAGKAGEFQGVIIQPYIRDGQEMVIGMYQDPVFGPIIMTGLGGAQVELIKDVSFSLHPLTDLEPERMLARLKSAALLKGWRGRPPGDVGAFKEALLRLSALTEDFPEIEEAEVNPLLVRREGLGCMALDARIYVKAGQ